MKEQNRFESGTSAAVGRGPAASERATASRLSYKYQRLRERLREAIASREFSGKLPGERALARRFHVNAKTLSKALTDLAAEGLLDRSIGRGTYVKGSAPAAVKTGRWLILCDPEAADDCVTTALRDASDDARVVTKAAEAMRPSLLAGFSAVIDLSSATPEPFLRHLAVRGVPVVAVGREPRTYSMHAVLADVPLAVGRIGRELLLGGHRRFGAVERPGNHLISQSLRQLAARYTPEAIVESAAQADAMTLVDHGATTLICDSTVTAQRVQASLADRASGGEISLAAVGYTPDADGKDVPCTGSYVLCAVLVDAIVNLLSEALPTRPAVLWLGGEYIDRGTLAPLSQHSLVKHAADTGLSA